MPKAYAASAAFHISQRALRAHRRGGHPPASLASFGRIEATPIREVDPKRLPLETLRAVVPQSRPCSIRRPPAWPAPGPRVPAAGWATQTDAEFIGRTTRPTGGRCRVLPDAPSGRKRRQENNAYAGGRQWTRRKSASWSKRCPRPSPTRSVRTRSPASSLLPSSPSSCPPSGASSPWTTSCGFTSTVVGSTTDTPASGTRTVRSRKSVGTPEWICPQQVGLSAG